MAAQVLPEAPAPEEAATAPEPFTTDLGRLAAGLASRRQQIAAGQTAAFERRRIASERVAAEREPLVHGVEAALAERTSAARAVPEEQALPPAPPLQRTPFLGGKEQDLVGGFLNALMTLGGAVAGLVHGDGMTAANALTAAMQGWMATDDALIDRSLQRWEVASESILRKNQAARQHYRDILEASGVTLDQKLASLEIADRYNANLFQHLDASERHYDRMLKEIEDHELKLHGFQEARDRLKAAAEERKTARGERAEEREEVRQERVEERQAEQAQRKREKREEVERAFPPDAINLAATDFLMTKNMPFGFGGIETRGRVIQRAGEILREHQLKETDLPAIRARYHANQAEMSRLSVLSGQVQSFTRTFDHNLDVALELNEKAERGKRPIINRWVVAGRRAIAGDADVSAFDTAIRTVVNEYSKISTSVTGAGAISSDAARREADFLLNVAQNPEQFRRSADILKRDTKNRTRGFEEQFADIERRLASPFERRGAAPPPARPAEPGPPPGWRFR